MVWLLYTEAREINLWGICVTGHGAISCLSGNSTQTKRFKLELLFQQVINK